jgi:hypothetical protein
VARHLRVPLAWVFKGLTGVLPMPPRVGDIPRIKSQNPISLREVSRASAASGEKITLPEAPVGVPRFCRVAATSLAGRPVKVPLPRARNPKGHRWK